MKTKTKICRLLSFNLIAFQNTKIEIQVELNRNRDFFHASILYPLFGAKMFRISRRSVQKSIFFDSPEILQINLKKVNRFQEGTTRKFYNLFNAKVAFD